MGPWWFIKIRTCVNFPPPLFSLQFNYLSTPYIQRLRQPAVEVSHGWVHVDWCARYYTSLSKLDACVVIIYKIYIDNTEAFRIYRIKCSVPFNVMKSSLSSQHSISKKKHSIYVPQNPLIKDAPNLPNLDIYRLSLQLSLRNLLKLSARRRMKVQLEQRRQAMLQPHMSEQQLNWPLKCGLYYRYGGSFYSQNRTAIHATPRCKN